MLDEVGDDLEREAPVSPKYAVGEVVLGLFSCFEAASFSATPLPPVLIVLCVIWDIVGPFLVDVSKEGSGQDFYIEGV